MFEERKYRRWFKGANLVFFDVCVLETDLMIGANANIYGQALESVEKYRRQLEGYIRENPSFLTSLVPVPARTGAPEIAARMCEASAKVGVGPMAAVAGALSELVGIDLLELSGEVIVENGGDIFVKTDVPRKIGVYAGKSPLNERIAIEIQPRDTPMGVCTSSGTVGHSLSFGGADAAVVLSKDAFLADAAATALGNIVKSAEDIEKALDWASGISGISGAIVIAGERLGVWGNIKLVSF